jgi:GNAT superfamily N-acetyltransferase
MLKVIQWSEFAEGIAKHWRAAEPETIPIWNNPFGIVRYPRELWASSVLCFPCAWEEDGKFVAFTSVYNISDSILRTRGVYVLPEYRGRGIGPKLMRESWNCFPESFWRVIEWFKESDSEWHGMKRVPGTALEWSSFSKCTLELCYEDRAHKTYDNWKSRRFIQQFRPLAGLGGILGIDIDDWDAYFNKHEGYYPYRQFDFGFGQEEYAQRLKKMHGYGQIDGCKEQGILL